MQENETHLMMNTLRRYGSSDN